jgi:ABC-type sugar transport system ATPase subunit
MERASASGGAGEARSPERPAIYVRGATKIYGATVALAGADLTVEPGEIHGLLGENGSGKSTMVRLLAEVEEADAGELRLFGESVGSHRAGEAAFIHQDLALFPTLTVASNIALGAGFQQRFGLIKEEATIGAAQEVLDRLGLACDARDFVGELPLADQTGVAIARAVSGGMRLLVLDEPTAYLEARQVATLLDLLRRLRDEGIACLLITHRAADVLETCDNVTVLREGETVAERPASGLDEAQLVEMISGHQPESLTRSGSTRSGTSRPIFELREVGGQGFGPLSLSVGSGEVVSVCGLADAGSATIGQLAFGLVQPDSGEILIDGQPVSLHDPRAAMDEGVAFVPGERRGAALAEELTALENLFMQPLGSGLTFLQARQERRRARELMTEFAVDPVAPDHLMTTFSGGNQQKVVMGKWMERQPRLLVLNEPTAGVDLGAKAEIHAIIARACEEHGLGVLLISSDFSEVAELSDRIYVMFHRQIFAELNRDEATGERLVSLAYGRSEQ